MARNRFESGRKMTAPATYSSGFVVFIAMLACCSSSFASAFHPSSLSSASASASGLCSALVTKLEADSRLLRPSQCGTVSELAALSPKRVRLDQENDYFSPSWSESEPPTEGLSRRSWLSRVPHNLGVITAATALAASGAFPAHAASDDIGEVTDKVFVDISGLSSSASAELGQTQRIVLGLFGKDAPESVQKLQRLHSSAGLVGPCKPLKEDFLIQREQLEANKVYRSCTETKDKGTTYDYAQIWRIIKDERIDLGSVSGKFIAREFPTWAEKAATKSTSDYLSLNGPKYLAAVRKGSDSGFGYTIFPVATASSNQDLLDNYLVVGKVLEGEEVVAKINAVSVVSSAKNLNYMAIVGGGGAKSNAPSRSCRYGGPMYCNENKPLIKLTMFRTGVL